MTETPLRIVHLVSSLLVGGLEHFAVRVAHAQQREGHRVSLAALRDGPLRQEAESLGLPVYLLNDGNKLLRIARGTALFQRLRADIVNAHNPVTLRYAALSKIAGSRIIVTCHGRGKQDYAPPGANLWRKADAVVAVSQAVADQERNDAIAERLTVIRNGVEPKPAQRSRAETRAALGLAESAIIGVMAARIDHLKGHDTLLHALAALKERGIAFTMLLAGDGQERAARERLAQELGLDATRVRFLGFRNDVPDLLAASDLFVLPSLTEGLPLSTLEAMSHRLPVIATTVGGIPETLTHEREGLLIPPQDVPALTQSLIRLIQNGALRHEYGEAGARRVREEFSFQRMLCDYERVYKGVRKTP